jgi:hypothetical protein
MDWLPGLAQLAWRQIVPAVILLDGTQEMVETLAARGLICRSVPSHIPLPVRPALGKTRRWEFKILTATGHVITVMESVR